MIDNANAHHPLTDGQAPSLNPGQSPLMGKSPHLNTGHSVVWNIRGEPGSPVPAVLPPPVSTASLLTGRA